MKTQLNTELKIKSTAPDGIAECMTTELSNNRMKVEIIDGLGYGVIYVFQDNDTDKAVDMCNSLVAIMSQCIEIIHDVGIPE